MGINIYWTDSKTLTAASRSTLLDTLSSDPINLGWSVRVVRYVPASYAYSFSNEFISSSPQAISSGMLRRPPINLNRQSENATILLIREILAKGIQLSEVNEPNSLLIPIKTVIFCLGLR
jgi:ribonuclease H2 subunit A